jgi:hypothetical protein
MVDAGEAPVVFGNDRGVDKEQKVSGMPGVWSASSIASSGDEEARLETSLRW